MYVTFTERRMTNTITIHNTTIDQSIPFQVLFHTYYRIDDSNALNGDVCYVQGLDGYCLLEDKANPKNIDVGKPLLDNDPPITISSEVDRVYSPSSENDASNNSTKVVTVGVASNKSVRVQCSGSISETRDSKTKASSCPVSYVVWNPFQEKAAGMSDFGNEEYHDMICVEPGLLSDSSKTNQQQRSVLLLPPNQVATLTQTIDVV
jgi:glucose-6-phosphate 1-epimerase